MVLCEAICGGKMLIVKSMTYSKFSLLLPLLLREVFFLMECKRNVDCEESLCTFGTTLNQPKINKLRFLYSCIFKL